jgi:CubicO group peptidase (beta-lactamase class C family)
VGARRLVRDSALAALSLVFALRTADAQREPYPGVDAYIANAVKTWKIPGLSVAIIRNDSVVFTKGYGVLSVGGTTPVTDQTLFEIGSTTKAFTATLAAMLVADGKLRFDDRVITYLPDFRLYDPVASAELTVRDALTHRGGMGRGELMWLGSGATRAEVIHRLRFLKPESPFRSRFSYQNMVFTVAGEATAKAAGTTWEALVKQRIFTPLGMTSTLATSKGMTATNVARPHGMDRDSVFARAFMKGEHIAPAGSILSSARDMAQWVRFQLGDGTFGGKRLVSAAALRETHTPQILTGIGGPGRGGDAAPVTVFSSYGMGWIVEDYRRNLAWQHSGGTEGMTAQVSMLPERRFGVVVLSNMASAQLPGIVARYLLDRELGVAAGDPSGDAYSRTVAQRRVADSMQVVQAGQRATDEPPVPLSALVGTYADSEYGEATISLDNGRLTLQRGEWRGPLDYWNASNFRWNTGPGSVVGPMNIKFEIAPDGRVLGMYFGLAGDVYLMGRKAPPGGRGSTR